MKTKQRLIVTLLMAMFMGIQVMAQQAYAFLSTDGKTLTFYYDTQKDNRTGGTAYALNTGYSYPEWNTGCVVREVVFNSSFKDARPTTTFFWFYNQTKLTKITGISNLNTSAVKNMGVMFYNCSSLTSLDISSFDTREVTNMGSMFESCSSLTSLDLSNFNTSKVTNMNYMFHGCSGLTSLDLSNFDTSNVTNMMCMFYGCSGLTSLDVSSFNTSEATGLFRFFEDCSSLTNLDISSFDTRKVDDMRNMFNNDKSLTTIYVGSQWDTSNVRSSEGTMMFSGCTSLKGEKGTTYNPDYTGKEYAHIDNTSNPGYLSSVSSLYNLTVAGTKVTAGNRNDILGNGIFAYTPASKTLSVKGSYTNTGNSYLIQTGIDGLTVNVTKNATLSNSNKTVFYQNGGSSTFKGNGRLTITGRIGLLIDNAGSVTIDNMNMIIFVKYCGIEGERFGKSKLTIRSSDVTITANEEGGTATEFLKSTMLEGCHITEPANYRFSNGDIIDNSDGQFAYSVTIEKDNGITTGGVERLNDNGEMINDKAREEWYTIDGRKISGKPTKKGIYIRNGKAVVN